MPNDRGSLPAGSAQFDLDAPIPRPSEAIPLQVALPTAGGRQRLDLTPAQTLQLHSLSNEAEL